MTILTPVVTQFGNRIFYVCHIDNCFFVTSFLRCWSQRFSLTSGSDSFGLPIISRLLFVFSCRFDMSVFLSSVVPKPLRLQRYTFFSIYANLFVYLYKKGGRLTVFLSRRGDSNTRPPRPERGALPTALLLGLLRKPRLFYEQNFLGFLKSGCKGTAFF